MIQNDLDCLVHHAGFNHDLDFDLGNKINRIFRPAVDFRMAFLATESFDLAHGHTADARLGEGILDLLELNPHIS